MSIKERESKFFVYVHVFLVHRWEGMHERASLEPRPSSPRFYLAALEKNEGLGSRL